MYIAIEGIDTAGKSTQIVQLQKHFGNDCVVTKEPGGTEVGQKIRTMLLGGEVCSKRGEFLLFLADRAEHIEQVIMPNKDKTIICDRSAVSGVAYAMQSGNIKTDELVALNHFATSRHYPDVVFLLELTKEELVNRLAQKELDGIEKRGVEYLLEIQEHIKTAAKLLGIKLIVVDATKSIEKITKTIVEKLTLL